MEYFIGDLLPNLSLPTITDRNKKFFHDVGAGIGMLIYRKSDKSVEILLS